MKGLRERGGQSYLVVAVMVILLLPSVFSLATMAKSWAPRVVATVDLGGRAMSVAVDSRAGLVFATSAPNSIGPGNSSTKPLLVEVNASTGEVLRTLTVGNGSGPLAVDPLAGRVYEVNRGQGSVSVIDESTWTVVSTISVGNDPDGIAVNPDLGMVYVSNGGTNTLSVINATKGRETAQVVVGNNPSGIAVDQVSGTVYVAGSPDLIAVINGTSNVLIRTITLNDMPFALGVDSSTGTIYASLYFSRSLLVVNGSTDIPLTEVQVNSSTDFSGGIAVNPDTHDVYLTNRDSDSVSIIDGTTFTLKGTARVGHYPQGVAVDPATGFAYVANLYSNSLSIVSSGPGPTDTYVSCSPSLIRLGASSSCTVALYGSSPTGNVSWTASGEGGVSFPSGTCALSFSTCTVSLNGTRAGEVLVRAEYDGDGSNPASSGSTSITVSDPSRVSSDLVQHEFVIPASPSNRVDLVPDHPIQQGDLLVVGAVFGTNNSGSIKDSSSNNWSGETNPNPYSYPNDPTLGTGIWSAKAALGTNDTITITSGGSVALVEFFELRGANFSSIGRYGGGGTGGLVGLGSVNCSNGCPQLPGAFIFVIGGSISGPGASCYPFEGIPGEGYPPQGPGFTIEPFCGSQSPSTGNRLWVEYGLTDYPGFSVGLGLTPAVEQYSLDQVLVVGISTPSVSALSESGISGSQSMAQSYALLAVIASVVAVFLFTSTRKSPPRP
ncbi:MAG: YncE family protein [archaeon]|nr:MAG: YncE family protein [archaeon]